MENESRILGKIGVDASGQATVREPIFVSLSSFKKTRYLDIRKYYEKDGEWLPGQKGVTLHGDQFEELLNLLQTHKEQIDSWLKE